MTGSDNHTPLTQEELERLREEYRANNACVKAIEEAISQGFDGAYLDKDCARKVVEEFGSQRVGRVLAVTVQDLSWDGRFSRRALEWANAQNITPKDRERINKITSHPAVLDGFVGQYLKVAQEMSQEPRQEQRSSFPEMTL